MLIEVESKFGETINMQDIDGRVLDRTAKGARRESVDLSGLAAAADAEKAAQADPAAAAQHSHVAQRRKAATDSRNAAFELALETRVPTDVLAERRLESDAAEAAYDELRAEKQRLAELDTVPATYCYSGQKLQYTELKKAEQRARLSRDRDVVFVRATLSRRQRLNSRYIEKSLGVWCGETG